MLFLFTIIKPRGNSLASALNQFKVGFQIDMKTYIAVDLDGTFLKTDLLHEGWIRLMTQSPWRCLIALGVLLTHGKLAFKKYIALHTHLSPEVLPVNSIVHTLLREQTNSGRSALLVSASVQNLVSDIAAHHTEIFQTSYGSENHNLKGQHKIDFLDQKYGANNWLYIGNSSADIPILQHAGGYFVGSKSQFESAFARFENVQHLPTELNSMKACVKSLRPHQWSKNVLIFMAIIAAHQFNDTAKLVQLGLFFAGFCLMASAVYLLNDLLDLEKDRRHPTKMHRPLASGDLQIPAALSLFFVLIFATALLCSAMEQTATAATVFGVYFLANVFYSTWFKSQFGIDLFFLTFMYLIRIIGGGVILNIPLSVWFLSFFGFLFFGFSALKRYVEVQKVKDISQTRVGYKTEHAQMLLILGLTTNVAAVLISILYLSSPEVSFLYQQKQILLGIAPLLGMMITRLWVKAVHGEIDHDPVTTVLKDGYVYAFIAALATILWIAK